MNIIIETNYENICEITRMRANKYEVKGYTYALSQPDYWDGKSVIISIRNQEGNHIGGLNMNIQTNSDIPGSFHYRTTAMDVGEFDAAVRETKEFHIDELFRLHAVLGQNHIFAHTRAVYKVISECRLHRKPTQKKHSFLVLPITDGHDQVYKLFANHVGLQISPMPWKGQVPGYDNLQPLLLYE